MRPDDQELCSGFACGDEPYEQDVAGFIQERVWSPGRPKTERTILITTDADELVGFGTWKVRDKVRLGDTDEDVTVVDVAYFGLDTQFQGETDEDGNRLAGVLFATLEDDARQQGVLGPDTPVHLVCDVRNERARQFWLRRGFVEIEQLDFEDVSYHRMIRRPT